ncbi:hypothetical protein CVT25_009176, partial [Psilocybe cyanescens]
HVSLAHLYKLLSFIVNSSFHPPNTQITTDSQTNQFNFSSVLQDYSVLSTEPEHHTIGLGSSLSLTAMLNSDDITELDTLGQAGPDSFNNSLITGSGIFTMDTSSSSTAGFISESLNNSLNVPTLGNSSQEYYQFISEPGTSYNFSRVQGGDQLELDDEASTRGRGRPRKADFFGPQLTDEQLKARMPSLRDPTAPRGPSTPSMAAWLGKSRVPQNSAMPVQQTTSAQASTLVPLTSPLPNSDSIPIRTIIPEVEDGAVLEIEVEYDADNNPIGIENFNEGTTEFNDQDPAL